MFGAGWGDSHPANLSVWRSRGRPQPHLGVAIKPVPVLLLPLRSEDRECLHICCLEAGECFAPQLRRETKWSFLLLLTCLAEAPKRVPVCRSRTSTDRNQGLGKLVLLSPLIEGICLISSANVQIRLPLPVCPRSEKLWPLHHCPIYLSRICTCNQSNICTSCL
jgi:hypothetical protein